MKDHANAVVSDEDFADRQNKWSFDVPDTKEGYYIRQVFDGEIFTLESFFS
jgi:asparagine synthase (glutamine-hydrolysing)